MRKDVPLKELHFGHEADPPINMRKTNREADVESMAASLDAHGQGQPLLVREVDGKHGRALYVEDGNRRLAGMRLLEKRGNITGDTLVEIKISDKEGLVPGELGLALNIEQVPPHKADQYEKFYELHEKHGLTADQIGVRFGIDKKVVRQALALGKVSPVILDDWRNDKIEVDIVKAFTMAPNLKEQEAVYKRLKKSNDLWWRPIAEAFGVGSQEVNRNLKFVGRKEYEKAGGKVTENLFGDDVAVSDAPLLAKLGREKLVVKRDELRADGWSWVELPADMPTNDWRYYWPRIATKKAATVEEKAKSGCVVELKSDGTVEVSYGLVRPAAIKPKPATPGAVSKTEPERKKGPAVLSNSLSFDLDSMAARAAQDALKVEAPEPTLARVLAGIVAAQITPERMSYMPSSVRDKLKAIRDATTPAVMDASLRKAFNAERYFKGAPKEFVIKAIREAVSQEQATKLDKGTKAAAWKFAIENVPKTGWLPPELRTAHYAGPGAKAKAEPKAAKAPRKKAA